jgi:hypothetical protein
MPQENNTRKEGVKGCHYADSFAISAEHSGAHDYYITAEASNGLVRQVINGADLNHKTTCYNDSHLNEQTV